MHMLYTGDPHDICAISFTPVADIEHPVGFDSTHAFECECIVEWLTKSRCTNPITSEIIGPVPISSVLKPLIIGESFNVDTVEHTIEILKTAGNAVDSEHIAQVNNKISFF